MRVSQRAGRGESYVDIDEGSPVGAEGRVVVLAETLGQLVCAVHSAEAV
jgi:hypothetical protein